MTLEEIISLKLKNLYVEIERLRNNSLKLDEETEKLIKEQERIQANLTEKFLRTFLRLSEQYNNLNITAYPYEIDSYLSLEVAGRLTSENKLLNDISISITDNVKRL